MPSGLTAVQLEIRERHDADHSTDDIGPDHRGEDEAQRAACTSPISSLATCTRSASPAFEIVPELVPREDEAVLDKLAFSAFEGTPLAMILRDCGLTAFALVGIAIEIGIDPTVRHGADLGLVPIVVQDACGAGNREAAQRALANLAFMGDAIMTDAATFCAAMGGETAAR